MYSLGTVVPSYETQHQLWGLESSLLPMLFHSCFYGKEKAIFEADIHWPKPLFITLFRHTLSLPSLSTFTHSRNFPGSSGVQVQNPENVDHLVLCPHPQFHHFHFTLNTCSVP